MATDNVQYMLHKEIWLTMNNTGDSSAPKLHKLMLEIKPTLQFLATFGEF